MQQLSDHSEVDYDMDLDFELRSNEVSICIVQPVNSLFSLGMLA
jgi:hypothetical protein